MTQPERIGKYHILEEIGYGGFATVYKAIDTHLNRTVALKVMHPYWQGDDHFVERFRREGHAMQKLQHPQIITVYESGTLDGYLYIAMEYVPGPTLKEVLKKEQVLPLDQAVAILEQIASALDYAHQQGIIHRDIKPANVILDSSTTSMRAMLLDFGLVKALASSSALTSRGMLIGSPEYMAPEQANLERRSDVGPAADRYALGILAYRMLTGRVPFPGNTPATLNAHENKPVPPPKDWRPDLPEEIANALLKMLAKNHQERFASASAFVTQLRVIVDAENNLQRRNRQLATLYTQLEAAARAKRWREVLNLSHNIQAIDRHYRDVQTQIDSARQALSQPPPRQRTWHGWLMGIVSLILITLIVGWRIGWLRTHSPPLNSALGETWMRPRDRMVMIYVPPGTLLMGAADGDPDEKPVHMVELEGFWLDRTEVTQAQYQKCVVAGVCQSPSAPTDPTYPIVNVTWHDAVAYCAWAKARLPSEAEWEYAFRGPAAYRYPWGNIWAPAPLNFCDTSCTEDWATADINDSYRQLAPADTFAEGASWCGALNMAGNAWEWVQDWYDEGYYTMTPSQSPSGPPDGTQRVLRGGSWRSAPYNTRGSYRFSAPPDQRDITWGFRCARQ